MQVTYVLGLTFLILIADESKVLKSVDLLIKRPNIFFFNDHLGIVESLIYRRFSYERVGVGIF